MFYKFKIFIKIDYKKFKILFYIYIYTYFTELIFISENEEKFSNLKTATYIESFLASRFAEFDIRRTSGTTSAGSNILNTLDITSAKLNTKRALACTSAEEPQIKKEDWAVSKSKTKKKQIRYLKT